MHPKRTSVRAGAGGAHGHAGAGGDGTASLRPQTFENPQDWPHNLNDQGLANVHQVFRVLTDAATGRVSSSMSGGGMVSRGTRG